MLVALYGVLAVAASFRSAVQVLRDFEDAPLAYSLSAVAAVVYVVATVALARGGSLRRLAWVAVGLELVGVVVVGSLSLASPGLFPDETVWSGFGSGYGYVPLVLPVLGLLWLRRTRPRTAVDAR
ncbi:membrane protein [Cellulomonas carbonis]|nr:membrane protein [Cellulomonas carbonis]